MNEQIVTPVTMPSGGVELAGDLHVPQPATGVVVFAHGSGSGRHSPRNRAVAAHLNRAGIATLLMDLLTLDEEEEERFTRHHRFDIELLSGRLIDATRFVAAHDAAAGLAIGYFGASTGAAAALVAAAREPAGIEAVVSRGGRPDLAGAFLPAVAAPTLLIVGSRDVEVLAMNRSAAEAMTAPVTIEIVPGATHLFPEEGALEAVADLARDFFLAHLASASGDAG
jgi:pimeloyl-ACP methyl ester carboxylesterase